MPTNAVRCLLCEVICCSFGQPIFVMCQCFDDSDSRVAVGYKDGAPARAYDKDAAWIDFADGLTYIGGEAQQVEDEVSEEKVEPAVEPTL